MSHTIWNAGRLKQTQQTQISKRKLLKIKARYKRNLKKNSIVVNTATIKLSWSIKLSFEKAIRQISGKPIQEK